MAKKKLIYFTSDNCSPCEEVGELIKQQRVSNPDIDKIEVIDIGTDEGFQRFHDMVLSKEDGGVPRAYLDGKKCQIEILDDETVFFNCPSNGQPSGQLEKSSLPEDAEQHTDAQPEPQPSPPEQQQ